MTLQLKFRGIFQIMRLTDQQARIIREIAHDLAGNRATIRLFGSRLDDSARGGDIDLLLEIAEPVDKPALLAARLSARISRALQGRKVDVIVDAPKLKRLPVHEIAFREGILL